MASFAFLWPVAMTPQQICSQEGAAALPAGVPTASVAAPALLLEGLGLGLELMAAGRHALTHLHEGARRMASCSASGSHRLAHLPGVRHLAGVGVQAALKGGALAALIEAPVALLEEGLALHRGQKAPMASALAAGGKMAAAAMAGGAGAGLASGLGSLGLGGLLTPIAPALLLVGGVSVAVSSGLRLRAAFGIQARPAAIPCAPPAAVFDLNRGQVVRHEAVWFALPAD